MNREWTGLVMHYEKEGASARFEKICTVLYKKIYSSQNVRNVQVKKGDQGIDIFIGKIGVEPISVIQCKFFPNGIGKSQIDQIGNSFKTVMSSSEFVVGKWTLAIINTLDIDENIRWSNWITKTISEYKLSDEFIDLKDGDDLIQLSQEHQVYDMVFERGDSIKLDEIHKSLIHVLTLNELKEVFEKTSFYISRFKNHFGNNIETHIKRPEVQTILNWVEADWESSQKNIFIVEGEKGNGKTVIIRDVYEELKDKGYPVLCIKADKYYDESPAGLGEKLFINSKVTFTEIKKVIFNHSERLVLIIDQLDALSQTLSSNREYLYTYNRIIADFEDIQDVKVIISIRSFDLKYDADLSVYGRDEYKKIKVDRLTESAVVKILSTYNLSGFPQRLIQLLRTPSHLEIFSKLRNKHTIDTKAIHSSKNLFDELWNDIVSSKPELKIKELLYRIAGDMYDNEQKIAIQNKFNDSYFRELAYLKSNQILIEDDDVIQFFHQTLYEYCFSRHFIDSGYQLRSYIIENGQSIYIRSVVMMITEYLRDADIREYIKTIKEILESSVFRFHIKTVILSILGSIQRPMEQEKRFVVENILYNSELADVFINSIHSHGWLNIIVEENYFNRNFLEKMPLPWHFFRKNIGYDPVNTIQYLESIEDFENKRAYIEDILSRNENWSHQGLLPYFEKYITYHNSSKRRNLWYFDILTRIADYHIGFVFDMLSKILLLLYEDSPLNDSIDSQLLALFEKLKLKDRDTLLKVLLDAYDNVTRGCEYYETYREVNCPFYFSNRFGVRFPSTNKEESIEGYLLKCIKELACKRENFVRFYNEYKNSNCLYFLYFLVEGLRGGAEFFKDQVFELIQIIYLKNGFNTKDDYFQFSLRKLVGETFVYFTNDEKQKVLEIINTITSPYENIHIFSYPAGYQKKKTVNSVGKKKYLFLKSLPQQELKKFRWSNKIFQELQRKFEPTSDERPLDTSYGEIVTVQAPLSPSAYKNMTLEDWEKSMIKFDEDYQSEFFSSKGGLEEHAREFYNVVKQNPKQYALFISRLLYMPKVSVAYIISGFEGLIDGQYNIAYTKEVFKKLINIIPHYRYHYTLISKARRFIEQNDLDEDIFHYLKSIVNQKENTEQNNIEENLASIRGNAIEAIILCNTYKEYAEQIFQIVEDVIEEKNIPVNFAIIRNLAYLNHLNLERAFGIFKKIVATDNFRILKDSLWSAKFFNVRFHFEMYPYFERIMEHEELHKEANIIVLSWIDDNINDQDLYNAFVSKSSNAKLCAIKIAEYNLFDSTGQLRKKPLSILYQFLSEKEEENENSFSLAYASLILRKFKNERQFPIAFEFFKQYSSSKHCRKSPAYFLEYLIKCSAKYPLECMTLLKNIDFATAPNMQSGGYYQEEPIKAFLAIYSVLAKNKYKHKQALEDCLDLFDKLMQFNHLRELSNMAIEMVLD